MHSHRRLCRKPDQFIHQRLALTVGERQEVGIRDEGHAGGQGSVTRLVDPFSTPYQLGNRITAQLKDRVNSSAPVVHPFRPPALGIPRPPPGNPFPPALLEKNPTPPLLVCEEGTDGVHHAGPSVLLLAPPIHRNQEPPCTSSSKPRPAG